MVEREPMPKTFLSITLALVSLSALQAQDLVRINDSKIRAVLNNNSTVVSVSIVNSADHVIKAGLSLAWLGIDDKELNASRRDVELKPGQSDIEIPLPLATPSIWTRLRYTLTPARAEARAFGIINGIVSLPHIADYVFELRLSLFGNPKPGGRITVFGEAVHPVTREPVPGIEWIAKLTIDKKDVTPAQVAKRNDFFVEFTFDLPQAIAAINERGKIEVSGRLGDFTQKASLNLYVGSGLSGLIQTDKPIYQPGQTMHLRAILQDARGRAAQETKATLRIEDQSGEQVHGIQLVSSKFGVIHDDWLIPETASLGTYNLSLGGDAEYYQFAQHTVRVSRYELPTFTVQAKPDRTYYLPGQKPQVAITGSYLFGKPVPKGHVKVVRNNEPRWMPQRRKSESSETTVAEGDANEDGQFTAPLDLAADYENLGKQERTQFRDIHFAAYYKDLSSGSTEQRRFDVRITLEPIHIYVIHGKGGGTLPSPLYISTSYADGRPASVSVEIRLHGRVITLHTNRYGVGRTLIPGDDGSNNEEDGNGLEITTTDAGGITGHWREPYWRTGTEPFRLETAYTIHRIGEAVSIKITAPPESPGDQSLIVHALIGTERIASRIVQITNHKGDVTFPYQPEFQGTVSFIAWNAVNRYVHNLTQALGSKAVIFPNRPDLKISAAADRSTYKPGDQAALHVQVAGSDGKPVEAALGLAIVDQAIMERARTDMEFGTRPWFSCAFCRDDGEQEIGGVRLNDLYQMKPGFSPSPEIDLAAEALVANASNFFMNRESETAADRPQYAIFKTQAQQLTTALDNYFLRSFDIPQDSISLAQILGNQWTQLRDPWGTPYSAEFSYSRRDRVISLKSAGPDKQPGTPDDFVAMTYQRPFFAPIESLIRDALKHLEDYPATEAEFTDLLRDHGLLFGSLRDPWETPYKLKISTRSALRSIEILSAGPDRRFETRDDVVVASFSGPYFTKEGSQIEAALQKATVAPQTIEEFQKTLENAGIDLSRLRDDWDRPYRIRITLGSRYDDRIRFTNTRVFNGPATLQKDSIPVTRTYVTFSIHSIGPDGIENTNDDFDVARFPVLIKEEYTKPESTASLQQLSMPKGTGVIAGTATDASGAVLSGANLRLSNPSGISYETTTDQKGNFRFLSVPAGVYSLTAEMPGFQTYRLTDIPVTDAKTTKADFELLVAGVATQIEVSTSAAGMILESSSSVGSVVTATPRVRDYFPETLLWLPELVTDANGLAQTKIKLADTVTNWKMAVIASTQDGRIAEAESDFRTFQPFFLDFNPPPILTQGDQIDIPVTVRNYRDQAQKVNVSLASNDWSMVQGNATQQVSIPANSSVNVAYSIQAKQANAKAAQRITASSGHGGDTIEKTLRVHPDGREIKQTVGDLVASPISFQLPIPAESISGAIQGVLRIYPNVTSMLLESAEAILNVPHGCAEQTISAGYANLIAWRLARRAGVQNQRFEELALANVRTAIDGLVRYRSPDWGIRYWDSGNPDIAVTAYALGFLLDASEINLLSADDLQLMVSWLEKHQQPDGTWIPETTGVTPSDPKVLLLTGTVMRSLAAAQKAGLEIKPGVLAGAYHQIAQFTDSMDEPYMLASFVSAALDSGDEALLGNAVARLVALGREERSGLYWDLRTNSPFYGWGKAGRYETSGLVISALSAWRAKHPESKDLDAPIRRGFLFLLHGRDQSGMWYSTQSTLQAMRAMTDVQMVLGGFGSQGGTIEVRSNGRSVKTVNMPAGSKIMDPIIVDLSSSLSPGDNQISLVPSEGMQNAIVLASSIHWIPWEKSQVRPSPELRLSIQFDKLTAHAGELVRCSVKAERVGFRGYGMMLSEIGLPPGAEVDRASLEPIIEDESLGVARYEVLPDRLIFYLWPTAGGSSFDFYLSIRSPMNAKSAPSLLYDYYNPEAVSELPPFRWIVQKP